MTKTKIYEYITLHILCNNVSQFDILLNFIICFFYNFNKILWLFVQNNFN